MQRIPAQQQMQTIVCILAAGRSRRFAGSKLSVSIDSQPILTWLRRRLKSVEPAQYWLSLGPGQALPPGGEVFARIIRDSQPHRGPLHAIREILDAAAQGDLVAVVPADMPLVTPGYIGGLLDQVRQDVRAAAAMGRWEDGPRRARAQPLPSAWRVSTARPMIQRALVQGLAGPSQIAGWRDVGCTALWHQRDASSFLDINRRQDMAAVAEALGVQVTVKE